MQWTVTKGEKEKERFSGSSGAVQFLLSLESGGIYVLLHNSEGTGAEMQTCSSYPDSSRAMTAPSFCYLP